MKLYSSRILRAFAIALAFVLLTLSLQSLHAQSETARYYYYQGTRIPLTVNPNLIAVSFNASLSAQAKKELAEATGALENFDASAAAPIGGVTFVPLRAGQDSLAAMERLRANAGVAFVAPVYDFESMQLGETNEFLARFATDVSAADLARINNANAVSLISALPNSARVFILKPNANNSRSAREMANVYVETGVAEFAEPNFVLREPRVAPLRVLSANAPELAPSDSNFGLQWGLKNTQQFQGSQSGADINVVRAWDVTQGASNLTVAVIDEGVFGSHSELSGKVLTGYNALNGSNNTTPKTNDHHGTGIAGVIAAHSNNNAGIAGVCWTCKILPVKVAETDAQGNWVTTTATLAAGIDWAWQNGADVLNNSWTMNAPSDSVRLAIINARVAGRGGKGSTVVFASGNQDSNSVAFPASLNSYVIAVGATNWCDQRKTPSNNACNNTNGAWGSNYGSALDLVAPGEAIYTLCNGNQCTNGAYTYTSGTSLATPLVAGTAALLYSLNPNMTPDQIQTALQNGAKDLGAAGRDDETGYGRLDAYRALAALFNLKIKINQSKNFVRVDDTVEYTIKYSNTGSAAMHNTQVFITLPNFTAYDSSTPAFVQHNSNTYRLDLDTLASSASGTATFRLQVQPAAAGKQITLNAKITGAFPETSTSDNQASSNALVILRDLFLPLLKYRAK